MRVLKEYNSGAGMCESVGGTRWSESEEYDLERQNM